MPSLSPVDKRDLLDLARRALGTFLERGEVIEPDSGSNASKARRAAFVTLRERETDRLLGCRGETHARRTLAESVIRHAIAAGTDDPRFAHVTRGQLDSVSIHINALTPLTRTHPNDFELGRHGLLLVQGRSSGLLLPEVPRRFGYQTRESFLRAVCRKAGLAEESWMQPELRLFRFETEEWGDDA